MKKKLIELLELKVFEGSRTTLGTIALIGLYIYQAKAIEYGLMPLPEDQFKIASGALIGAIAYFAKKHKDK